MYKKEIQFFIFLFCFYRYYRYIRNVYISYFYIPDNQEKRESEVQNIVREVIYGVKCFLAKGLGTRSYIRG